jgi:hypothetical protein
MLALSDSSMELLLSIALLAVFIVGVELTSMGWTDAGLAGRLTGLFGSRADLGWPSGVQEDDDHRWPDRLELAAFERRPSSSAWVAEILEDHVRPVPVIPVRRIR